MAILWVAALQQKKAHVQQTIQKGTPLKRLLTS